MALFAKISGNDYEAAFGPRNYSLNTGKFHVVVLDNIYFEVEANGFCSSTISYGLEDDYLDWLRSDLTHVSADRSFSGNCSDTFVLRGTDEDTQYRLRCCDAGFPLAELRLVYE